MSNCEEFVFDNNTIVRSFEDKNGKLLFIGDDICSCLGNSNGRKLIRTTCINFISIDDAVKNNILQYSNEVSKVQPYTLLVDTDDAALLVNASKKADGQIVTWLLKDVIFGAGLLRNLLNQEREHTKQLIATAVANNQNNHAPITFAGFPLQRIFDCFDLDTLTDYINKTHKVNLKKQQINEYLRQLRWMEWSNTNPTKFAIRNEYMTIHAMPILYCNQIEIGKSVRTVINKDNIHLFESYLEYKGVISL